MKSKQQSMSIQLSQPEKQKLMIKTPHLKETALTILHLMWLKSMNFNVAQKHESPSDQKSVQIPKTEVQSFTCILGWRLILLHKLSIAQIHTAYGCSNLDLLRSIQGGVSEVKWPKPRRRASCQTHGPGVPKQANDDCKSLLIFRWHHDKRLGIRAFNWKCSMTLLWFIYTPSVVL